MPAPEITQRGAERPGLAAGAVGLREALFQSIGHMAPGAAIALFLPFGVRFSGGAAPLSVLLAAVACLLVASSIGQLARTSPSAAGFAAYAAQGLHPVAGFLVGWAYAFVEPLVAPMLALVVGVTVGRTLSVEAGWPADLWWVWATATAVVVFGVGYAGIRVSARTVTVLGIVQVGIFLALGLWLILEADVGNISSIFGTEFANAPGFPGMSGVLAGAVYMLPAFVGFEAAVPLGEEVRAPRHTVRQATVGSTVIVGLLYVLAVYGATSFFGPERMAVEFQGFNSANPWDGMARLLWPPAWVLVFVAVVASAVANCTAGATAATRTWFALGRARVLPGALESVHPRFRTPRTAILAQFLLTVVLSTALGTALGPISAFGLMATMLVMVMVAIYITMNVTCIAMYWRFHRGEANPVLHGAVPVLGIAALIPALLTASGIPAFDFVGTLEHPLSLAPILVGAWMIAGVAYAATTRRRAPDRLSRLSGVAPAGLPRAEHLRHG